MIMSMFWLASSSSILRLWARWVAKSSSTSILAHLKATVFEQGRIASYRHSTCPALNKHGRWRFSRPSMVRDWADWYPWSKLPKSHDLLDIRPSGTASRKILAYSKNVERSFGQDEHKEISRKEGIEEIANRCQRRWWRRQSLPTN